MRAGGSPLYSPHGRRNEALDAKLKLHADDEHRVVVIRTPDGLDSMSDEQVPRSRGGQVSMSEAKHGPPAPDRLSADEGCGQLVSGAEQLMLRLDPDAESRRELDAARQAHAARVASLAQGDAAGRIEACLDYLAELGRIALRSQHRAAVNPARMKAAAGDEGSGALAEGAAGGGTQRGGAASPVG